MCIKWDFWGSVDMCKDVTDKLALGLQFSKPLSFIANTTAAYIIL